MKIKEQNLNEPQDQQLNMVNVICSVCGSQDIKHEETIGRGLPPKSYNRPKLMPISKISWCGTWDIWTCSNCGEIWKKLRK